MIFSFDKIKTANTNTLIKKVNVKILEKCYDYTLKEEMISDTILLAVMLNTECRGCSLIEKESLAYIAFKRAKENFGNYGYSLKEQLFYPKQFSGMKQKNKNFRFFSNEKESLENYIIAKSILLGKVPKYHCKDCFYFLNPDIATDTIQKQKALKNKIKTSPLFKHIIHA